MLTFALASLIKYVISGRLFRFTAKISGVIPHCSQRIVNSIVWVFAELYHSLDFSTITSEEHKFLLM